MFIVSYFLFFIPDYNQAEIVMIKDLFSEKNGIKAYDFHKKYSLLPSVIIKFIDKGEKAGHLQLKPNNIIWLTPGGRDWVVANKKSIYLESKPKYWKLLPKGMIKEPIGDLYLPDEKLIDKNFFDKLSE